MTDGRGKHGTHRRGPKVDRVAITCETCGTVKLWLPCQARQRTGRFCSRKCRGKAVDTRLVIQCGHCQRPVPKRRDHLAKQKAAYCSIDCRDAARLVPNAKWRDKEQVRGYMSAYMQRNKERHNERGREWSKRNPAKKNERRRLRRAAYVGGLTEVEWQAIKKAHGYICLRCQKPESLLLTLEPDHVVALARGGAHLASNIQPLCRSCNAWKGAKTIDYRHGITITEVS